MSRASDRALGRALDESKAMRAADLEEKKKSLRRLHGSEEGFSDTVLARKLGLGETRVRQLREELGLPPHFKRRRRP